MKKQIALLIGVFLLSACHNASTTPVVLPTPPGPSAGPIVPPPGPTLLEKMIANGVPSGAAKAAMDKYNTFQGQVLNKDWITIVDFTQQSGHKRLYIVKMADGTVTSFVVAHGAGSDPKSTGTPYKFSNINGSHMSSLGGYLVKDVFNFPNHGLSMHVEGLEASNSLAGPRGIYIHPATYVSSTLSKQGMSWGCFAMNGEDIKVALARLPGSSFLYAYSTVTSIKASGAVKGEMVDESAAPLEGVW